MQVLFYTNYIDKVIYIDSKILAIAILYFVVLEKVATRGEGCGSIENKVVFI
jgi:hypothetical protein